MYEVCTDHMYVAGAVQQQQLPQQHQRQIYIIYLQMHACLLQDTSHRYNPYIHNHTPAVAVVSAHACIL